MTRTARCYACVWLALALLPRITSAQSLTTYAIVKSMAFTQTGQSKFSYNTATPFQFYASGAQIGSVTSPGPDSQVVSLTYDSADQTYEFVQNYATKAAMDAAFPSGTYTLAIIGESTVNLALNGDLYPPAPLVINGSWDGVTTLLVDPNSDVLLNFIPFPGYSIGGAESEVLFSISGNDGGSAVVSQIWDIPRKGQTDYLGGMTDVDGGFGELTLTLPSAFVTLPSGFVITIEEPVITVSPSVDVTTPFVTLNVLPSGFSIKRSPATIVWSLLDTMTPLGDETQLFRSLSLASGL
jgi:hypothetical protein